MAAARRVIRSSIFGGITSEPSSLAGFASLQKLNDYAREQEGGGPSKEQIYHSPSRVLVINTGMGIMGRDELNFIREAQIPW